MVYLKTLALFMLLACSQLHADTIGGEISFGFFNHQPNGDASYKGNNADIEDTLGYSEEQDIYLKA